MMIILTGRDHLLTAHKRRMLHSDSSSSATSRRNLQVGSFVVELKHSLEAFLTLISSVIEVPIH